MSGRLCRPGVAQRGARSIAGCAGWERRRGRGSLSGPGISRVFGRHSRPYGIRRPSEESGAVSSDLSGFSLLELFRMEAETYTATLSTGLVALEGAPALPETIEPLMRAAHSLKGAARIVGLD